ncbi:MAG: YbaN family protein [Pseudoxanthomonas sp.]|nr:YbaN family protein [Pseudoxanthomonas sp.]
MDERDRNRFRWAWWLLAYLSLAVGIAGIFLPGLPTTVFVIIAAWAATRGSARLEQRLLAHPRFGPVILAWRRNRSVPRRAKWAATWTMLACAAVLLLVMVAVPSHRAWMVVVPIACMAVVGTWLWLRPEPSAADSDPAP